MDAHHSSKILNNIQYFLTKWAIKIETDYCISMAPETTAIKINTKFQMQQSDKTNRGSTNQNHFSEVKTNSGEVIELSEMEKEKWDKTS